MTITDLDYPYSIELVKITEGYTDQGTGEYVPGTESVIEISGHVQDITAKMLQSFPQGEYSIGDRKIYTDADVEVGDVIRITEGDGSVSEWIVKDFERDYNVLSKHDVVRKSFLLKRKA